MNSNENKLTQEKFDNISGKAFNEGNNIYSLFMYIFSFLNTISTGIVLWILFRKTPNEMKHYKWFLLNVALSAYAMDIWQTLFGQPFIVPISDDIHGFCILGLMKYFFVDHDRWGSLISWLIHTEFLGFFATSLSFAIIYRYLSLKGAEHLLISKRALFIKICTQIFFSLPCLYFMFSCSHEAELSIEIMEYMEYQLYKKMEDQSCFFNMKSKVFTLTFIGFILLGLSIISIFTILADQSLRRIRASISLDTYRYQRQLILSLSIQFIVPAILVAGCNLFILFMIFVDSSEITTISRICFALSSFHTTANAIAMFSCIQPYRRAIIEIGYKFKKFIIHPFSFKIHPIMPQINTNLN